MCGFYDDKSKIKKGDKAKYNGENITIVSCKHIKENKTMDITFKDTYNQQQIVNIPYMTSGYGFKYESV